MVGEACIQQDYTYWSCACWLLHGDWRWDSHSSYLRKGNIWRALGGIMFCVTGTEALFADLSQFPVIAIQLAFTIVVFPCLLLAYAGQAAYLMKNSENVHNIFYQSIPDSIYWPVCIIATAAACVASQATISATFSLIKQAVALGCFPRVKVVHTSKKYSTSYIFQKLIGCL